MKSLLSVFTAVTVSTAPVINAEPDVFMSFDFQNGELERGFDDWYYSDKGENPCGVYAGETRSKLCGPENSKLYLLYNSYNNDHMGWLRYGFIDSSTNVSVNGNALKLQTTGGAYRVSDDLVDFRGINTRSKSDMPSHQLSPDELGIGESPNYLGKMSLYIKGDNSYSRFPQLQGKNRFSIWVLLPSENFDLSNFSRAHLSSTDSRVSWYPFIGRSTGGHYYHRSANVPMGGWTKIQFDAHPTHYNGGSNNQYSAFSSGGYEYPGDGISYFNNIATMSLVFKGANAQPRFQNFYLDEFTTDYVPYQNEETINNLGVGFSPKTKQFDISFEDKYRCLDCDAKYEVKYSFSPIDNHNYQDAFTPEFTVNFNRSRSNNHGLIHKPNKGYNLLWAAIDIKEEHKSLLTPFKKIYFAVKDLSDRSNINTQEIDEQLVNVPGIGNIKNVDLIKTIDYKIIPVRFPLSLTTDTINRMTTGQHFEQQLTGFGGEEPYSFSASSLPNGISISASGRLHGIPSIAQNYETNVEVKDALGNSYSQIYNVEVVEPESFFISNCSVVVDFKESQDNSIIYDNRFTTIFKDRYTDFTAEGTTIKIGANKNYDYQGIRGPGFALYPGDSIRLIWKNASTESITFAPRVSFIDEDRVSSIDTAGWLTASEITVRPAESAASTLQINEVVSSEFINVNVNYSHNSKLILDRIELVESSNTSGGVCSRGFSEDVNVTMLVVDFKDSVNSSIKPMTELSEIIKDRYTGIIGEGSGTEIGENGTYNFQGITGSGQKVLSGDKIKLTWINVSDEYVDMSPRLSFDETGRYKTSSSKWHQLPTINIPSYETVTSVYEFTESNAGLIKIINVNNNLNKHGTILLDKIELVTKNPRFGFVTSDELRLVSGEKINAKIKINNLSLLKYISNYSELPRGVYLDLDGTLSGEPAEPGNYQVNLVAESILGHMAYQTLNINIIEPENFVTESCKVLVDFNDGQEGWRNLSDELSHIETDIYTDFHINGMSTTIGTNKNYNYQLLRGLIQIPNTDSELRTIWFNHSQETITFSPRVSFIKEGRFSNLDHENTWLHMSEITVPPGSHAVSSINLSSYEGIEISTININVNHESQRTLTLNRVEVQSVALGNSQTCPGV
ncbi:putative Ig domain-containing protein [Alteromonas sp. MmMcT2-2]|uniref:putative Ig domain-containing protein n=1 Tax=Alteromonas sp. MmMcT2-2 TaxID=2917732 RepID=UPI001EF3D3FC|nr:putative Ig domain-containing protein [Alteromonas sp. MmMcT2-2]MCG7641516.1 putative Ig domain-containing protein [Alteromonas sp. MmMcT2-2]